MEICVLAAAFMYVILGSGVPQLALGSENMPKAIEDINKSTERYRRTQLRCRIATEPNLKPFPKGLDDFRTNPDMNTYADLFGDGSIEFITGANDSTYIKEDQNFPNEGNEARATKPINHPIYSPQPDFKLGLDLNFHNAHFFTVDVNGDDKDDVVFAQQGRDWAPFQKMSNYVLLSSEDAYQLIRLPGRKSPFHHGTAGDIDNDGDTDIIIVPGMENRIIAYINRGDGTFDFREVGGTKQKSWDDNERYFFASLWDLDDDGFLDLILGSQKSKTKIIWGTGSSDFDGDATEFGDETDYYFDFEFRDFNGNGVKELITLGGAYNPKSKYQKNYKGWHFQKFELRDRTIKKIQDIEKVMHHSNMFLENFAACDIQKDGDLDLVFERSRQFYRSLALAKKDPTLNFSTITRVIWYNTDKGFERIRIEDPNYYPHASKDIKQAIIEHAKNLGSTAERYMPSQQYYPFDQPGNYLQFKRHKFAQPFLDQLK